MKVIVFSDSHGNISNMARALEKNATVDALIHLGDVVKDLEEISNKYKINIFSIHGNCDLIVKPCTEKIISLGEKQILITHGHNQRVKTNYDTISYLAEEKEVDICLFGHTHIPEIFHFNNIIFMNPGSISLPRKTKEPTYGIIEISQCGEIYPSIFTLN